MGNTRITEAIMIASSFLCNRYPVDIGRICKELGIMVITNHSLDKDGYLICQNGKKIVLVNSQITNYHRRNFIIAHELGHFFLHREQLFSCDRITELQQSNINSNSQMQETEANAFATELLIPSKELLKVIPNGFITFRDIFRIADTFDVSVTHAALQAVKKSKTESEILICYENNMHKWYSTANRNITPQMVPGSSPISLEMAKPKTEILGGWTKLFSGMVHQEVFSPYEGQYLVLLSGEPE